MSFEKDITEVKKLMEDGELFKAANSDEVERREAEVNINREKELYDNAEAKLPGSVAILRQAFKKEAVVQAAIAYADIGKANKILSKLTGVRHDDWAADRAGYKIRDLDWVGPWTDGQTLIEQAQMIEGYNAFGPDVAEDLARYYQGKEFRLGREGSVAVYIRPISVEEFKNVEEGETYANDKSHITFAQDETSLDGVILRLWWD